MAARLVFILDRCGAATGAVGVSSGMPQISHPRSFVPSLVTFFSLVSLSSSSPSQGPNFALRAFLFRASCSDFVILYILRGGFLRIYKSCFYQGNQSSPGQERNGISCLVPHCTCVLTAITLRFGSHFQLCASVYLRLTTYPAVIITALFSLTHLN